MGPDSELVQGGHANFSWPFWGKGTLSCWCSCLKLRPRTIERRLYDVYLVRVQDKPWGIQMSGEPLCWVETEPGHQAYADLSTIVIGSYLGLFLGSSLPTSHGSRTIGCQTSNPNPTKVPDFVSFFGHWVVFLSFWSQSFTIWRLLKVFAEILDENDAQVRYFDRLLAVETYHNSLVSKLKLKN